MHIASNPVSKASVAFEDVLKGLSATLAATENIDGCMGFEKRNNIHSA